MPDIEKRYGTKITAVGAARITACVLAGTKLKITQAAAGDGGGGYYVPTVDQTELVAELWRGPIVICRAKSRRAQYAGCQNRH